MNLTDPISFGSASLQLRDAQLRPDLLIDEFALDASTIRISPNGNDLKVETTKETKFRAVISQANLVKFVQANLPENVRGMIRETRITILQGKVQVQAVPSALPLTITVEATPTIVAGKTVELIWHGAQLAGIPFPSAMVDLVARHLNQSYDLSTLPIEFRIDEIRCEPGRLTVIGWAKLQWPL